MKPLELPEIPLPDRWVESVKRALMASFTLAHFTLVHLRAWSHETTHPLIRRELSIERLESEVALIKEQLRIVSARFAKVPPHSRPHFSATDRFAILGVKEARGWSMARAAREFLLSPRTIAMWLHEFDEGSLVEAPRGPVNKFPDFVTAVVQQLKTKFPLLGHRQIADWLARGGLHLAPTTVRRMLKKPVIKRPTEAPPFLPKTKPETDSGIVAKNPNHIWHSDITTVSTSFGLALGWWPFAFPALFPFCWKVIAVVDSYSRKVLAIRAFRKEPSGDDLVGVLNAAKKAAMGAPKHIITDKGSQFYDSKNKKPAARLSEWLCQNNVSSRFGAVGKKGSIAIIERFFRTFKSEGTRKILIPYGAHEVDTELNVFADWYNEKRPHSALSGATPVERFTGIEPPKFQPRYEVRPRYPVAPEHIASAKISRAKRIVLNSDSFKRRKHLPDVTLDAAA